MNVSRRSGQAAKNVLRDGSSNVLSSAPMSIIRPCSACVSPIRDEIDAALGRHERLRDIEARVHISRSSLSRHSRKCVAKGSGWTWASVTADLISGKAKLVTWMECDGDPMPELGERDVLVRVSFEVPPPPKPPIVKPPETGPIRADENSDPLDAWSIELDPN